jgi:tetratricopeptide (TPR) repeat protein
VADLQQAVRAAEAAADPLALLLTLNEQTRLLSYLSDPARIDSATQAVELARRGDSRRHALPILAARQLFAVAHCQQGDARLGLAEGRQLIQDLEREFGPNHSRTAEAHHAFTAALYQCGLADEALASARRSMAIDEARHGPDSHPMRIARLGLGGMLVNEGLLDEGVPLLRRVRDEFIAHEGTTHPLTVVGINRVASGLTKAGCLAEAADRLAELRPLCDGDARAHDDWCHEQARWLRESDRPDEALVLLESIQARRLDTGVALTVAAWWELLGSVLVDAGRPSDAVPVLQRALSLYAERQPFGSVAIARAQMELARARLALGEADEAVPLLQKSLTYWREPGPPRAPVAETAGWLALAAHAAGDAVLAQQHARHALAGPWREEVARVVRLRSALSALLSGAGHDTGPGA